MDIKNEWDQADSDREAQKELREVPLFLREIEISEEEKELRAWIKLNVQNFGDRGPEEIAMLALMNNFSASLVYSVLSSFKDAMQGTHIERRAAFEAYRLEGAIKQVQDLKEKMEKAKNPNMCDDLWKEFHGGNK